MAADLPLQAGVAADARSLDQLRAAARNDPKAMAKTAARQFEAQFAQMLMSQMRNTSLAGENDIFNSQASKTWRGMLDQQMSQALAGVPGEGAASGTTPSKSGLGLADIIEAQLSRQTIAPANLRANGGDLSTSTLALAQQALEKAPAVYSVPTRMAANRFDPSSMLSGHTGYTPRRIQNGEFKHRDRVEEADSANEALPGESVREAFIRKFLPAAQHAESVTGIPAEFMLGQAALESGWGKREIRGSDGKPTHNLFGIKATGWSGKVSMNMTTEYTNGQAERVQQPFRAYDSYEHAFEDYARLLSKNPRYAAVARAETPHQFAHGLQRAGYATDPEYGNKLLNTIRTAQKLSM